MNFLKFWEKPVHICQQLRPSLLRMSSSSVFTNSRGVKCRPARLPPSMANVYIPGQMYRYQESVRRLPVMPLDYILDKYLLSVQPLLTSSEYKTTEKVVKEYGKPGGVGENLHRRLVERSERLENWLSEWWDYYAYLAFRDSVVINVTPAIAYPRQAVSTRDEFIRTAAKFVNITTRYLMVVLSEAIPPAVYRKSPQCMSQYVRNGCRIPGKHADTLKPNAPPNSRHMIIMRKGHYYKLDVYYETPTGEIGVVPASYILEQLKWIVEDAKEANPYPVGVLTTEQRDRWFNARERLREDSLNCETCDVIENAVYGVCLDETHNGLSATPGKMNDRDAELLASRALHGNGTGRNTCNRWFDLTSQVIIGEDGGCGSILEHSSMDGPAAITTNIFVMDFIKSGYDVFAEESDVDMSTLKPAQRLEWNLSTETIRDIENAKLTIDKSIRNLHMSIMTFDSFGKNFPKSLKLSPDGFVQAAVQLAYYKLYGRPTAMYESGSIRWFKYGRTDTIRSCTNAAHAFVKTMTDPKASAQDKFNSLVASVEAHSQYTNDAISGKGIDRHLLGMKILAVEAGEPTPQLFNDVAYQRSTHFCLSTSQVPVPEYDIFLCFGPVVPDGYGVCYNPQEKRILFSISSFHDYPDTDSMLFGDKLKECLQEMRQAALAANEPKSKL